MKRKNAFTLIELLAIIVILAVIAVITVPIILNIIENSKKGAIADSAYGYKSAVDKYYLSKLSDTPDFKLNGVYTVSNGELNGEDVPLSGRKPSIGSLVYTNNVLKDGCLQFEEYKVTFENGSVASTEVGECSWVSYVDSDNNGSISLGDSVKIEADEFYVIAPPEDGKVKLLPKYNLNSSSRQSSSSTKIKFSADSYWWDSTNNKVYNSYQNDSSGKTYIYTRDTQNNFYSYFESYKSYLVGLGVTDIIDVRMMSYAEAVGVGCSESSSSCPTYLSNQYYWIGSLYSEYNVWLINSDRHCFDNGRFYGNDAGVRPVVIISESSILVP